jgi:type II secretory pathway pseudopilin PulG
MTLRERIKARLVGDAQGFTIIEVLVAAFILVLASLAVFMTLAAAIQNVQRSRDNQQTVSVAQRELERIRATGMTSYDELGLNAAPGPFYDRVSGSSFDLDRGDGVEPKPLVIGGTVAPVERRSSSDGTQFTINAFVTCEWLSDGECVAKRIVVAARPDARANAGGYQQTYRELQTTVIAPAEDP